MTIEEIKPLVFLKILKVNLKCLPHLPPFLLKSQILQEIENTYKPYP